VEISTLTWQPHWPSQYSSGQPRWPPGLRRSGRSLQPGWTGYGKPG